MRQTNRLKQKHIDNAKASERLYKLVDGEGLALHINPNGSRLWRLQPPQWRWAAGKWRPQGESNPCCQRERLES